MLTERTEAAITSFDSNENAGREIQYPDRPAVRPLWRTRVLRFVPQDTHIPEAQSVAVPAQDRDFARPLWHSARRGGQTIRRSGLCGCLKSRRKSARRRQCAGWAAPAFSLAAAPHLKSRMPKGPERIAMEWWRQANKPTRDYFRVETRDGQRFWLYRDGLLSAERSGAALVSAWNFRVSYAELAVTTNYLLPARRFASRANLSNRPRSLGYPAIGIADRNTLAGVVRAYAAWEKLDADGRGPRLLVGARLVFRDGTPDILAYPQDRAAYGRLCQLLSLGKCARPRANVFWICRSAGLSRRPAADRDAAGANRQDLEPLLAALGARYLAGGRHAVYGRRPPPPESADAAGRESTGAADRGQ